MKKVSSIFIIFIFIISFLHIPFIQADENLEYEGLKEIDSEKVVSLVIKTGGAQIEFKEDTDKIFISPELEVLKSKEGLEIKAPSYLSFLNWFDRDDYKIIIGNKREYSLIKINVGGAYIKGKLKSKKIILNSGGMRCDAQILASEKVTVRGGGIDLEGVIVTPELNAYGAGLDLSLEVRKTASIVLKGVGMDANIKYLDRWDDTRTISMKGIGGDLYLLVPSENNSFKEGQLNIDTQGIIDVKVDHYQ